MAAKKPAKKAAKATKKPAAKAAPKKSAVKKPAATKSAKKAVAKKPVAKKAAPVKKAAVKKTAVKKPVATKATPAAKPAAKKAAPAKSAANHAAKPAATSKPAAKPAVVKKPAPRPATKTAPMALATETKAASAKPVASKAQETVKSSPARAASRPVGKVAVVVVSREKAPAPRGKVKVIEYKSDEATGRPIVPQGYVPSSDEEYMNPLQLEYFRQRLLQWRAVLVVESKQSIENLKDEVRDVGDEAERGTRETENSLELRTRDRYRKLISKIDSTLKGMDAGAYGYCVDTGEEIGLERLEARLTAERTLDAQDRWEHLQKQMGD